MDHPTCWKNCRYCSPTSYGRDHKKKEFRVYRKCQKHGNNCYESSLICDQSTFIWREHATRFKPVKAVAAAQQVVKPVGPGWEDF